MLFLKLAITVAAILAGCSLYQFFRLKKSGGAVLAQMLGGRDIPAYTKDAADKYVLTLSAEIAESAGVSAPAIYVLDEVETAINGFVAGTREDNTVITLSRGLINTLDRDELRGVLNHAVSQIQQGDVFFATRLWCLMYGLGWSGIVGKALCRSLVLAGDKAWRNGHYDPQSDVVAASSRRWLLLWRLLTLNWWAGEFFFRLCQQQWSHFRGPVLDAESVNLTENSFGLLRTLKQIRKKGSALDHPAAFTIEHLCLASVNRHSTVLESLLPVSERIRNLEFLRLSSLAKSRGAELSPFELELSEEELLLVSPEQRKKLQIRQQQSKDQQLARRLGVDASALMQGRVQLQKLPERVAAAAADIHNARRVVFILLLSEDEQIRQAQLIAIEDFYGIVMRSDTRALAQWYDAVSRPLQLQLLDVVLAAITELPMAAQQKFIHCIDAIIRCDTSAQKRTVLFMLHHILRDVLLPPATERFLPRALPAADLRSAVLGLLAFSAHALADDGIPAQNFYRIACACLQKVTGWTQWPDLQQIAVPPLNRFERIFVDLQGSGQSFRESCFAAFMQAFASADNMSLTAVQLLRMIGKKLDCPLPANACYPKQRQTGG